MRIALFKPRPVYIDHLLYGSRFSLLAYDLFANRYPPLGLLQLAAALEHAGHEVRVVDCDQMFLNAAAAARRVRGFAPHFIGVSAYIFNPAADLAFAGRLKEELGGPPLVLTGHFPRSYPEEALRHAHVDFALTGKGFTALPALAGVLSASGSVLLRQRRFGGQGLDSSSFGMALDSVPGVAFRRDGGVVRTAPEPFDLRAVPVPARHLVENRFYTSGLAHRRPITTILGSIGCPHRCYHCPEHLIRWHGRPVKAIVDEIEDGQARLGLNEWCFLDPIFNISKDRVMEFCQTVIDRRLDVSWTIKARADIADREMLAAMKHAGCTRIGYGIESGDQGVLDRLGRRIRLADITATLLMTREAGIPVIGYFMVGNCDDTRESLARTLDFVRGLPVDNILVATTTPLPGSALHAEVTAARGSDPWIDLARGGPMDPEAFRPPRSALPASELNGFAARMYRAFYRRPAFFKRAFVSPGSHRLYVLRGAQNAILNLGALCRGVAERLKAGPGRWPAS